MKKINVSTIDQAVKAIDIDCKRTIRTGIVDIEINLAVPFEKRVEIVNAVANAVVGEEYHPEIEDVVLFAVILQRCSNANIPTKTSDSGSIFDMDKIYKWYLVMKEQWDYIKTDEKMVDIIEACDKAITHRLRIIENKNPITELLTALGDSAEKIAEHKDDIDAMVDIFNKVPETYTVPTAEINSDMSKTDSEDDDSKVITVNYDSEGNMIL